MVPGGKYVNKFIDDELAFQKWFELGTIRKAQAWFAREGITNPHTGNPPTTMALWVASMRFVVNNMDLAREYYKQLVLDFDPEDDDEWYKYVVGVAAKRNVHSETRLVEWLNKHQLWDYYDGPLDRNSEYVESLSR